MQLTTNGLSHFSNQPLSSGKMSQESCHRQITPSDVSLPDWLEKMRHLNQVIDLNQEKVTRSGGGMANRLPCSKVLQCGCIYGPQRKVAWRILDAQYFGVAQRRRRVFVVASARTDLDPATVLFEFEGVRRDIAPSRGEGKETTRYTSNIAIRTCDDTNIISMAHGQGGAEIKTDNSAPTLTCNHEAPIVLLGDGRMRRLTPIECERLQGFPDGHTLIPTEKRKTVNSDELAYLRNHYPDLSEEEAAMLAADGPRYKAIGNSMAIPVMRWIGDRITKAVCRQKEGSETKERKVKPAAEFERSIFKWAGGKFGVLEQIFRYLPEGSA